IDGTTGGTYDLRGKTTAAIILTAQSNDGTTLIGNDADNEILFASATGNDTLIAGNGNNNVLIGGGGNDTLIVGSGKGDFLLGSAGVATLRGGTGNDTFQLQSPVAAGTTVTGGSGSNTLVANGDITQVGISNIQTLFITPSLDPATFEIGPGTITLTAAQFDAFSTIQTQSPLFVDPVTGLPLDLDAATVNAATSGTYSLVGRSSSAID